MDASARSRLEYWVHIDRLLAGRLSCHSALRVCITYNIYIYMYDIYFCLILYRGIHVKVVIIMVTLANVTFYSIFDIEAKCFGINNFTFYRHWLRHTIQIIPRIIGPHVLFSGHTALEIHWSYVHSQECMGWVNCRDVGFWHAKWLDTWMESYKHDHIAGLCWAPSPNINCACYRIYTPRLLYVMIFVYIILYYMYITTQLCSFMFADVVHVV